MWWYLAIFCRDHPRGYKTYYLIPTVIWSAGVHSTPGNNTIAIDNVQEELPLVPEQNELITGPNDPTMVNLSTDSGFW